MIFFQTHYASISANILHDLCFFSFPRENDDTDCFIKLSFTWEWWHWLHKSNDNFCSFSLNKPTNELPLPIKLLTTAFVKEKWGPKKWFLLPIKLITTTHQTSYHCFCKGKMRPQEMISATHQTYYHYPSNFLPLLL